MAATSGFAPALLEIILGTAKCDTAWILIKILMLTTMIPQLLRAEPELAPVLHDRKAVHDLLSEACFSVLQCTMPPEELFSDSWMAAAQKEAANRVVHGNGIDCLMERLTDRVAHELHIDSDEAALRIAGCDTYVYETATDWRAWFYANDGGMTVHVTGPSKALGSALTNELTQATRAAAYEKVAHAEPLPMVDFDTLDPAPGVMKCIGLVVDDNSALLAVMGRWGQVGGPAVGVVPIDALQMLIARAGREVQEGRWISLVPRASTLPVLCQCKSEFIAHLHIMGHVMNTGFLPPMCTSPSSYTAHHVFAETPAFGSDSLYARRGSLGQMSPTRNVGGLFTMGLAQTLAQLRVYKEAPFIHMVKRFKAAGATDLDKVVSQWIALRLPLLPGTLGTPGVCAKSMHKHAQMTVLSLRTRQRMEMRQSAIDHWAPSEIDAVLPSTVQEDIDAMRALGLTPCTVEHVPGLGTVASDIVDPAVKRRRVADGTHTDFPLRVMMNPSCHLDVLKQVLEDCKSRYNVDGAYAHFLQHAAPEIGQSLTLEDVERFRAACIRSPLYGRVFLWMCIHSYSCCAASDDSGILARTCPPVQTGVAWKGGWQVVGTLTRCTGGSYIDCGCGSMLYWRQVLMGGWSSYLFEIDLTALQQLAANLSPLPDGVHIVPCDWTGLVLSDIVPEGPAVCAAYRPGSELPAVGTCTEAHYMLADCADYETPGCPVHSDFMVPHGSSRWRHRSNSAGAVAKAALVQRMYMAT